MAQCPSSYLICKMLQGTLILVSIPLLVPNTKGVNESISTSSTCCWYLFLLFLLLLEYFRCCLVLLTFNTVNVHDSYIKRCWNSSCPETSALMTSLASELVTTLLKYSSSLLRGWWCGSISTLFQTFYWWIALIN